MRHRMTTLARKCPTLLFVTGLLLLTLVTGARAAGGNDTTQFPQENLVLRVQKIEQLKQVKIAFDETMVKDVIVPAVSIKQGATAGELLRQSLQGSNLDYKKYGETNYSIVRKPVVPDLKEPDETPKGKGSVSGMVLDEAGESLVGATILVTGTTLGTVTDLNGQYVLKQVPAGTHTIEIRFISYQTQQVSEVNVSNGKTTHLDLVMQPADEELGEVVVKADYKQASAEGLYARQQNSIQLMDGISADLIKKTSDNNVAQVLRRLPGVSVNDGKFVTVRGLSERYNNVNLNGANMPSTEPNRKNFSFDIIPSSLVDNVVVSKTFTPDMSAEFAGGSVNVNTLSIPEKKFLSVSVGGGFNDNSTGKEFLSGKRYTADFLLGNPSERYWFGRDFKPDQYMALIGGPLAGPDDMPDWEGAKAMNAKVPNNWGLYGYKASPMRNFSVSAGLPFQFGQHKFGIVMGLTYRHEEKIENYGEDSNDTTKVQFKYGPLTKIFASRSFKFSTGISAVGNIGWEYGNHKIDWKNLYSNRFTNSSAQEIIEDDNLTGQQMLLFNDPRRMQMYQTRLEGEHRLWNGAVKLGWYADYNKLDREQPDERNISGMLYNGQYVDWGRLGTEDGSFTHIFTGDLDENKKNIGINAELPFQLAGKPQKIKVGYDGNFRKAHYMQYVFNIVSNAAGTETSSGDAVYDFLTQDKFADGSLYYVPWGENPEGDGYDGKLNISSVYVMGDFMPLKAVHLSGGVRREDSEFSTDGVGKRDEHDIMRYDSTRVDNEVNWYPSVNLTWNITRRINMRGSYSKTISRFDFREISSQYYYDVLSGIEMRGTDSLRNTYVKNYDLRLEWYPAPGEVISLSAFYKDFTDPIEIYVWENANNYYSRPINLKGGTGKGLELNLRKSLGFIVPASFLKDIYVSSNAMVMDMEVKYEQSSWFGKDSIRTRPLQDLVPYSVNASLAWEGQKFGVALNYGTTGRKLVRSSTREEYDEYEAPRHVLDLQLRARFMEGRLEMKANASDLLAQPFITYRNTGINAYHFGIETTGNLDDMGYNKGEDWLLRKIYKGTSYSFSISYKF